MSPTLAGYLLRAGRKDRDRFELTSPELEVLRLVAGSETDREISVELYISVATVRSHLDRIRDKTGARRRVQMAAVHKAIRRDRP